ncbi:MAG TPA: NADH-quinone oxidoreductase subunit NuoE [Armatimonadota bacterium]|jgi:NADH-quinone oxidoreductase E subunit
MTETPAHPPIRILTKSSPDMRPLSEAARAKITKLMTRYPRKQSALLPALFVAQADHGYLTHGGIRDVAKMIGVTPTEVEGVATFYTMFAKRPVGQHVLQVCTTLSCALCGGIELLHHLEHRLGVKAGESTPDGKFTLMGVECLASCGTAPMMQVNDLYVENLTIEQADRLIDELQEKPGNYGREIAGHYDPNYRGLGSGTRYQSIGQENTPAAGTGLGDNHDLQS